MRGGLRARKTQLLRVAAVLLLAAVATTIWFVATNPVQNGVAVVAVLGVAAGWLASWYFSLAPPQPPPNPIEAANGPVLLWDAGPSSRTDHLAHEALTHAEAGILTRVAACDLHRDGAAAGLIRASAHKGYACIPLTDTELRAAHGSVERVLNRRSGNSPRHTFPVPRPFSVSIVMINGPASDYALDATREFLADWPTSRALLVDTASSRSSSANPRCIVCDAPQASASMQQKSNFKNWRPRDDEAWILIPASARGPRLGWLLAARALPRLAASATVLTALALWGLAELGVFDGSPTTENVRLALLVLAILLSPFAIVGAAMAVEYGGQRLVSVLDRTLFLASALLVGAALGYIVLAIKPHQSIGIGLSIAAIVLAVGYIQRHPGFSSRPALDSRAAAGFAAGFGWNVVGPLVGGSEYWPSWTMVAAAIGAFVSMRSRAWRLAGLIGLAGALLVATSAVDEKRGSPGAQIDWDLHVREEPTRALLALGIVVLLWTLAQRPLSQARRDGIVAASIAVVVTASAFGVQQLPDLKIVFGSPYTPDAQAYNALLTTVCLTALAVVAACTTLSSRFDRGLVSLSILSLATAIAELYGHGTFQAWPHVSDSYRAIVDYPIVIALAVLSVAIALTPGRLGRALKQHWEESGLANLSPLDGFVLWLAILFSTSRIGLTDFVHPASLSWATIGSGAAIIALMRFYPSARSERLLLALLLLLGVVLHHAFLQLELGVAFVVVLAATIIGGPVGGPRRIQGRPDRAGLVRAGVLVCLSTIVLGPNIATFLGSVFLIGSPALLIREREWADDSFSWIREAHERVLRWGYAIAAILIPIAGLMSYAVILSNIDRAGSPDADVARQQGAIFVALVTALAFLSVAWCWSVWTKSGWRGLLELSSGATPSRSFQHLLLHLVEVGGLRRDGSSVRGQGPDTILGSAAPPD